MKINVIMPTFNDADSIVETLESLRTQTFSNWHLTIVNDGSTDNTENVIKGYIKKHKLENNITYLYEENSDQLNAIKLALKNIEDQSGLIHILHSDDLLYDNYVFDTITNYYAKNPFKVLISNYDIIDQDSHVIGTQKVRKYKSKTSQIALQGLWLGRNLFLDFAFWDINIFRQNVYYNYLTWNTPFWLNHDMTLLDVKNSNFKTFKYRVYSENYINNEIGLLNVLNGELRTEIMILKHFHIPCYKIQYFIFRVLNKIHLPYHVFYSKKESKNPYNIIKFLIGKRLDLNTINKYPYYYSILKFFENKQSKRQIILKKINNQDLFYGSDIRKFNKLMLENKLPSIYYELFSQMQKGFNEVVTNQESYENLKVILKFLDIENYVNIIIE